MTCCLCNCEADVFVMEGDVVYFYCADCLTQLKKGQSGCTNLMRAKLAQNNSHHIEPGHHIPVLRLPVKSKKR